MNRDLFEALTTVLTISVFKIYNIEYYNRRYSSFRIKLDNFATNV